MGVALDRDSRKTPHVQVLSCKYVKTVSIFCPQARFQSSTPLHYLNIAIYLCKSVTPSKPSGVIDMSTLFIVDRIKHVQNS